jgi:hypothetical protein
LPCGQVLFGDPATGKFFITPNVYDPRMPEELWRPMRVEQMARVWGVWTWSRGLWPPHALAGMPFWQLLRELE